jgi:hypothetical protein
LLFFIQQRSSVIVHVSLSVLRVKATRAQSG